MSVRFKKSELLQQMVYWGRPFLLTRKVLVLFKPSVIFPPMFHSKDHRKKHLAWMSVSGCPHGFKAKQLWLKACLSALHYFMDFFFNVPMSRSLISTVLLSPKTCPGALSLRRESSGQGYENWTCQLQHNAISCVAFYLSSPVCCFSINVPTLVGNMNAKKSCRLQNTTLNSLRST